MARKYRLPANHAHGCTNCGLRYMDTCKTPGDNDRCVWCRSGKPRPADGWDPVACCAERSRPVRDTDTIARYALGGPGPWWQCRGCFRTHPFDPASANLSH